MPLRLPFLLFAVSILSPAFAADADSALLEELRALVEKSREQRAADRWLQRALDDLVARHDRPWTRTLLFDDFRDGDYRRAPAWRLLEGRFEVIRGRGLVARDPQPVTETAPAAPAPATQAPEDLGAALVGALLQQALGPAPRHSAPPQAAPSRIATGPDRLRVRADATNAFSLTATVRTGPTRPVRFELALLQSEQGRYGYRLVVDGEEGGHVELRRIRRGHEAIVERADLEGRLGDGALHDLVWEHRPDGTVRVLLDETELFSVRDRAFRDGYPWLELRHDRGDLELRAIRVEGTG